MMSRETEMLERIGAYVAADLGEGPSEERLLLQRRDFLAVVTAEPKSMRGLLAVGSLAAAALVAAALAFVFTLDDGNPEIRFRVGNSDAFGQEGQWVRTDGSAELPLRFDGGSELTLAPNASARMVHSNKKEVRLDLASGRVHCDINRNNITKWNVVAGPYTITVTGTIFDAKWEPQTGNLDVDVTRGSVLVSGADLSEHGVRLAKGDHLKVDGERAVISLSDASTEEEQSEASIEGVVFPEDLDQDEAPDTVAPRRPSRIGKRNLNRNGLKRRMIESTEASPAENAPDPNNMSLETLWQAASQARYEREASKAEALLKTVRRRFPGARQAQAVPFLMGRIQLELKGNPAGSLRWFKQYLQESPNGPLAEEALGRLIDASIRSGDAAGARRYATRYLKRYKKGLFDDLARSAVSD